MSSLPCVRGVTRERVSREFDDRGPDICRTEIMLELEADNPELLDMARRCARDVGDFSRIMTGFCMFYRVMVTEARATLAEAHRLNDRPQMNLLPRVSVTTRAGIVKRIESVGSKEFTRQTVAETERNNAELLLMWHNFAEDQPDYVGVMQGFALLYACLLTEAEQERSALH